MTGFTFSTDDLATSPTPAADLRQYLANHVTLTTSIGHRVSLEKLTLNLGRDFPRPEIARPASVAKGPNKACFRNARRLARRRPTTFRYVEGYATSDIGFPCHHAWVIDRHDTVVETTWEKQGSAYLGLVLSPDEVRRLPPGCSWLDLRCRMLWDDLADRRRVWG
jgi:hypothetical protein